MSVERNSLNWAAAFGGRNVAMSFTAVPGEVKTALAAAGWTLVRQHGSHEVWAHPSREGRVVVAGRDSDTVPVGTLGSIRRATGLEQLR